MAYAPLNHPSSIPIPMEQLTYSNEQSPPPAKGESFLDDYELPPGRNISPPPKPNFLIAAAVFVWKNLFLPAMGVIYLAFCYTCHYKLVRVGGITNPMEHLPIIKAGVTSISILFISLSLLPLYSLISDLRSEEFFRVLSGRPGAPLNSINSVSTPSHGTCDSLANLYRRHASHYFAGAFLAGLVGLAASTLAPAALSVDTVLFDGDLVALSVGAVQRNTVYNSSDFVNPQTGGPSAIASLKSSEGGSVAWAEHILGVNFSFQSPTIDKKTYAVPSPLKLTPGTTGRWITDVIAMQPVCEWIAPQFQTTNANFSDFSLDKSLVANLTSKHIQVKLDPTSLSGVNNFNLAPLTGNWFSDLGGFDSNRRLLDLNTNDDLMNGATVWQLVQCVSNCSSFSHPINITFPDFQPTRYASVDGQSVDIAFLYCAPNAEIETRHVSNDGKGSLTLGDRAQVPQGNLHAAQTNLLLPYAFKDFDKAGPVTATNVSRLGNQVQFTFLFGKDTNLDNPLLAPQPIAGISASYAKILQSAVKPFVDGSLATAHVPGRTTRELVVFAASLPHVIASTVLYLLLSVFVLVCHFRRHVPRFTFFSVAAALARSDIPPLFAQVKETEHRAEEDGAVPALKKAHVLFERGQVLKLRSDPS